MTCSALCSQMGRKTRRDRKFKCHNFTRTCFDYFIVVKLHYLYLKHPIFAHL